MKNNKENEELQSRREFFKEAAKRTLPVLAIAAFGSTMLSACEKDNYSGGGSSGGGSGSSGCKGCSGSCSDSCSGDCDGGCTNNCDSLCGGDCWSYCESTYKT